MSRVRIGTCSGAADLAIVRSMLAAHGIAAVVGAENHAGMLGALGGGFLSLDIWVDGADEEEAAALLRDLREREGSVAPDDEDDDEDDDNDDDDDVYHRDDRDADIAAHDAHGPGVDVAAGTYEPRAGGDRAEVSGRRDLSRGARTETVQLRTERRRRTAAVLLVGCFVTFGTAHMFTRAWGRGLALAGLEILGFLNLRVGNDLGGGFVAAAILADLVGALWRVRATPRSTLPEARVLGS